MVMTFAGICKPRKISFLSESLSSLVACQYLLFYSNTIEQFICDLGALGCDCYEK